MLSEQQQRIMGYFIEEAKDHLNTLEQGLLNLQATIADSEMVSEVFRAAHSVKGGAAMLGLDSIQHVAHKLEDYFKVLKECPIKVDQKLETLFLRVFDTLQELLEQLQGPFGLTDDKANEVMAEVEPVFGALKEHLSVLVNQSGSVPPEDVDLSPTQVPVAAPVAAARSQAVNHEESALQLIFQSDVPAQLREMLKLFKQADQLASRQQLQAVCTTLARAGEQFDLPTWCELLEFARRAIAHQDNTYRSLAPIVIKNIKQAQELVLAGQALNIQCGEDLRALVPALPVEELVETNLADLLAASSFGDEAAEPELFDFAADFDAASDQSASLDFDATGFDAADLDATDEAGDEHSWFTDATFAQDGDSLSGNSLGFDAIDTLSDALAEDAATGEEMDFEQAFAEPETQVANRKGPEVGIAELNSLADLFEGEVPELGMTWQEEEIMLDSTDNLSESLDLAASNDFSDLLFDQGKFGQDSSVEAIDDSDDDLSGLLNNSEFASSGFANNGDPAQVTPPDPLSELLDADFPSGEADPSADVDFSEFAFTDAVSSDALETPARPTSDLGNLNDLFGDVNEDELAIAADSELDDLGGLFGSDADLGDTDLTDALSDAWLSAETEPDAVIVDAPNLEPTTPLEPGDQDLSFDWGAMEQLDDDLFESAPEITAADSANLLDDNLDNEDNLLEDFDVAISDFADQAEPWAIASQPDSEVDRTAADEPLSIAEPLSITEDLTADLWDSSEGSADLDFDLGLSLGEVPDNALADDLLFDTDVDPFADTAAEALLPSETPLGLDLALSQNEESNESDPFLGTGAQADEDFFSSNADLDFMGAIASEITTDEIAADFQPIDLLDELSDEDSATPAANEPIASQEFRLFGDELDEAAIDSDELSADLGVDLGDLFGDETDTANSEADLGINLGRDLGANVEAVQPEAGLTDWFEDSSADDASLDLGDLGIDLETFDASGESTDSDFSLSSNSDEFDFNPVDLFDVSADSVGVDPDSTAEPDFALLLESEPTEVMSEDSFDADLFGMSLESDLSEATTDLDMTSSINPNPAGLEGADDNIDLDLGLMFDSDSPDSASDLEAPLDWDTDPTSQAADSPEGWLTADDYADFDLNPDADSAVRDDTADFDMPTAETADFDAAMLEFGSMESISRSTTADKLDALDLDAFGFDAASGDREPASVSFDQPLDDPFGFSSEEVTDTTDTDGWNDFDAMLGDDFSISSTSEPEIGGLTDLADSELDDFAGLLDEDVLSLAAPATESAIAAEADLDSLGDLDALLEEAEASSESLPDNFASEAIDSNLGDFGSLLDDSPQALDLLETPNTPANADLSDDFGDLDAFLGTDDALTGLPAEATAGSNSDDFGDLDALLDEDMTTGVEFPGSLPIAAENDDFNGDFGDLDALLGEELTEAAPVTNASLEDFADLEALLGEDVPVSGFPNAADAPDDFADLEALLGDEAAAPVTATNEFDDLEKLLEDADQTLGGPPTSRGARRQSLTPKKRSPGVLNDQTMRVSVKNLDNLNNLVGELVVNRNSLEQAQERLRQFLDNLLYQVQQLSDVGQRMRDLYERSLLESSLLSNRRSYQTPSQNSAHNHTSHSTGMSFDALEMDRFTGFHTLSQEMIELIVRVRESASDIDFVVDESDQVTRMFRQVTTQLQEGLTRSRMVPFDQTAARLPRAVRDISVKCGKQAELAIEGKDTLIDKMILEQLYDPMTHLVNNAITHGIETPEERQAAGKPPTGRITIRTFHQGNQTVISVMDDGAGIDPEKVKRKAIEKRLITPAEAREMSRLDVYDLLFHHGFSTKDKADDFSGRGVGMDVVRTSLNEIRGSINIDSNIGRGTTFTIRLPLTLSISKALCCISNRARIAFPMDGVEDMLDVPKERIQTDAEGRPCIHWRDSLLPFQPLSELLRYNRSLGRGSVYGGNQEDDIVSVVVLRSNAGSYLALQVDQVLGEQEIVIKQLEGPAPKPVGVAGATVLGDGRIMPIADVLELIDLSMGRIRREPGSSLWEKSDDQTPVEAPIAKTDPTVLIVDDSITVRELLSMTFNKVGYRVEQARDGQEAWEKLRSGLPCDLVFCDIEMPRMDGLELLSRIQKDVNLNHLPIAMLTSRGADRHRQMAVQLGAKGYFTKPYLEEALLDAAQRMLKGEVLVASSSNA
jgi:chemotaxis protein histidine kinase CheA/CheY-like chemotaxis protein